MQISRHWRIKSQRYRLEGVRLENGDLSLQNRPFSSQEHARKENKTTQTSTQTAVMVR
jgi:hypothetical protein